METLRYFTCVQHHKGNQCTTVQIKGSLKCIPTWGKRQTVCHKIKGEEERPQEDMTHHPNLLIIKSADKGKIEVQPTYLLITKGRVSTRQDFKPLYSNHNWQVITYHLYLPTDNLLSALLLPILHNIKTVLLACVTRNNHYTPIYWYVSDPVFIVKLPRNFHLHMPSRAYNLCIYNVALQL